MDCMSSMTMVSRAPKGILDLAHRQARSAPTMLFRPRPTTEHFRTRASIITTSRAFGSKLVAHRLVNVDELRPGLRRSSDAHGAGPSPTTASARLRRACLAPANRIRPSLSSRTLTTKMAPALCRKVIRHMLGSRRYVHFVWEVLRHGVRLLTHYLLYSVVACCCDRIVPVDISNLAGLSARSAERCYMA